jgi:hypothetical protein
MSEAVSNVELSWILQFSIAGSAPAYSTVPGQILNASTGTLSPNYTVPKGRVLVLDDVFITASQPVDGKLVIKRNNITNVAETVDINSLLVSNPSRPKISPVVFQEGDEVSFELKTIAANSGTSAVTDTVLVKYHLMVAAAAPAAGGQGGIVDRIRSSLRGLVS